LVAAVAAVEVRRGGEYEQARVGIEVTGLVRAQSCGVGGEDLVPMEMIGREAARVGFGE